jgi:putative endonuclease
MSRQGGKKRVHMFTTYVLQNTSSKKYYIGSTNNLERRLSEHNRGQTKSTRKEGKWVLIYKEIYSTNKESKLRERMIKSYKGGNGFKKMLEMRD